MGRELGLLGQSGPLWFYVPPKTAAFIITVSSPSPGETVTMTVRDPALREAARGSTVDRPKIELHVAVPPGADGKAWSLVPTKAPKGILEDYTIGLGDNLPPYWSLAADRLLVPSRSRSDQ
jgi:hypothetical protein